MNEAVVPLEQSRLNPVAVRPLTGIAMWPPRWLATLAFVFLTGYALGLTQPEWHPFLGGIIYQVPATVCLALLPWALAGSRGRQRAGIACVGLMLVSWLAGDAIYAIDSLLLDRETPVPSVADPLYYAGYAFLFSAIGLIAFSRRGFHDARAWVDGVTVVVVAGVLAWRFLIGPALEGHDGLTTAALTAAGYPLLDLALLVALIGTLYGDRRNYSPAIWMLALGIGILVASDTLFSLSMTDSVAAASLLDMGWLAAYWCFAAFLASWRVPPENVEPLPRGGQTIVGLTLPYAVVFPTVGLALAGAIKGEPDAFMIAGALGAATLLVVRQWLTLVENARLYRSLEATAHEMDRLRAEAVHLSRHDDLTGLLNRRAWLAEAAIAEPTAIVILDIDHFKRVNDTHGHPAGDTVLRETARRLEAIVGQRGIVGRVGGEEFALALCVPATGRSDLCETLFRELSPAEINVGAATVTVTLSGGCAGAAGALGASARAIGAAYSAADVALYMAKRSGRNRLVIADLDVSEAA